MSCKKAKEYRRLVRKQTDRIIQEFMTYIYTESFYQRARFAWVALVKKYHGESKIITWLRIVGVALVLFVVVAGWAAFIARFVGVI